MAEAGTATIPVEGDFSKFNAQAKRAAGKGGSLNKSLGVLGKGAAVAGVAIGVGLVVALKKSVQAFEESERIQAQTNARMKSTKGVANVTGKAIDKLAKSVSLKSGIDDEAVQAGANLLLTFTNVRNEMGRGNKIFNRASNAAADLATALNHGAIPSTEQMGKANILLGKALNDPIKGVTALQRVGVSFTADQKKQIKTLVESGKTLEAQKLILKELNTEFGGSAKAAGDTTTGAFAKLNVAVGNLQEGIGKGLAPTVKAATLALTREVRQWTPAFERAARDISAIFTRKDLSPGEKLSKAFAAVKINLGPLAREIERELRAADIGGKAEQAFQYAVPKIIDAFAAAAPRAGKAFINAFRGAGLGGQLLTVAFLASKLGAFGAAGNIAAATFRKVLIPKMAAAGVAGGIAAGGAEGASSAAVTGAFAGAGALSGKAFRVALIAAATVGVAVAVAEAVKQARGILPGLSDALRGRSGGSGGSGGGKSGGGPYGKGTMPLSEAIAKDKAKKGAANDLLLFPDDATIVKLQATIDKLQAAFDRRDRVMQRAELTAAIAKARKAKGHDGLGDAKKALADFNREASRASQLDKIQIKIQGVEQIRAVKGALVDIRGEIRGKLSDALDAFKDKWESSVGAQFDKDTTAAIANGPAAQALAALRAEDERIRAAAEDAANAKGLVDAKLTGDKSQIAAAQAAIEETARQRAIAAAQVAADAEADRIQVERQTARQTLYDADSTAFSTKLQKDLEAEAGQLETRKQSYRQFVKDINRILARIKIPGIDTSADIEAVLGKKQKRHSGGPVNAGQAYIVGGPGAEELFVPNRAGQVIPIGKGRSDGPLIGEVNIYESDRLSENDIANRLAWKIETAAA